MDNSYLNYHAEAIKNYVSPWLPLVCGNIAGQTEKDEMPAVIITTVGGLVTVVYNPLDLYDVYFVGDYENKTAENIYADELGKTILSLVLGKENAANMLKELEKYVK